MILLVWRELTVLLGQEYLFFHTADLLIMDASNFHYCSQCKILNFHFEASESDPRSAYRFLCSQIENFAFTNDKTSGVWRILAPPLVIGAAGSLDRPSFSQPPYDWGTEFVLWVPLPQKLILQPWLGGQTLERSTLTISGGTWPTTTS
jgi:hypothetical protein